MRRRNLGLLGRIVLALLAVGLLPLIVSSAGLVGLNRTAMTEQVLRTHTVMVRAASARVGAMLEARRSALEGAAGALAIDGAGPVGQEALGALLRSDLGLVGAVLFDGDGFEIVRAQRRGWQSVVDQVLEGAESREEWSVRAAVADGVRTEWLRLDLPLADGAWLLGVVDLEPIRGALQPLEIGGFAALTVADPAMGRVLGERNLELFPAEMLAVARSGRAFGAGRYGQGDEATIGAVAAIPETRWVVLSRQPAAVAESTARELQRRSLAAVALATLLLGLASGAAYRTLVRPIRELLVDHQRLAGLHTQNGGNELDRLRASFRQLAERIQAREELGEVFLGRYQVTDLIGQGAMGSVFRGWDPALQRPVALKTVRFDRGASSEQKQLASQLLAEATNVAQFNHPNIVAVHDVQQAPEVAFLALEYVEGTNLADYYESRAPLAPVAVVQIGLGVSRGLAAAHDRGIVHHDIKPANILLGVDGSLKIVDFGVSRAISVSESGSGFVVGTPGFIAPEAIQGQGYGPSADLFALGALLYQGLTGSLPFGGATVRETLIDTIQRPVRAPSTQVPGIPAALDRLVVGLLVKDPAQRTSHASVVVAALERLEARLGRVDLLGTSVSLDPWEDRPTLWLPPEPTISAG